VFLFPGRHSSVLLHASAPPSGPDVMGYRSHRERTATRSGAGLRPTHDSDLSWRTPPHGGWAGSLLRGDHTDRALWVARAGGRGLSGKGRKSQRSSNPASQRHRVVGFHDIHSSGFAVSAPVARAVTDIRSQCVRWAGDRGLPPAKSNNSHGCDSSVSTRARGSGRKDLGYRTQRSQVQVLPHARRV
jgi:hypothetical protein